jgi:zinc transporter ZupT
VEHIGGRSGGAAAGLPLLLGALLDGIPEQTVLGIGLAAGQGVSIALLVAIFVSNLPESIGSATDMKAAGRKSRTIVLGWTVVAVVCTLATIGGYAVARLVGDRFTGAVNGFAAGALLVMLVGSMIPEAKEGEHRCWPRCCTGLRRSSRTIHHVVEVSSKVGTAVSAEQSRVPLTVEYDYLALTRRRA